MNGIVVTKSIILCSEIQLKSPNWLFGQRKYEENGSAPKDAAEEATNGESAEDKGVDCFRNQYWVSSGDDNNDEDIVQRYVNKIKCIHVLYQMPIV